MLTMSILVNLVPIRVMRQIFTLDLAKVSPKTNDVYRSSANRCHVDHEAKVIYCLKNYSEYENVSFHRGDPISPSHSEVHPFNIQQIFGHHRPSRTRD